jgi:hypothetical protein
MAQITKPITVVRQEFIEKIVDEINTCGLPLFVVEPILKDLLNEISTAVKKQYEMEKAQYEQALASQNNEQVINKNKQE